MGRAGAQGLGPVQGQAAEIQRPPDFFIVLAGK